MDISFVGGFYYVYLLMMSYERNLVSVTANRGILGQTGVSRSASVFPNSTLVGDSYISFTFMNIL